MSAPNPISGVSPLNIGSTYIFTDTTIGGDWTSTNTAVATVDIASGVVSAIGQGNCQIVYTVGSAATAFQLSVQNASVVTNGLNFDTVYNGLKNRVLWQSEGITSLSNRYFEDFHPLCNTEILDAVRPKSGLSLTTYLANKMRSVIMECVQAVYNERQLIDKAQLCFQRPDVMLYPQPVMNVGQFVGIKMLISPQNDVAVKFNTLELFFDNDCTFNMYLYNDMTQAPVYIKSVTASKLQQVIVNLSTDVIQSYLSSNSKGGIWYFGYYQNDIEAQGAKAMYYSIYNTTFHGAWLWAFSAPMWTGATVLPNFQRNNIGSNNLTYGLNIEVETFTDATNTIVQGANLWDEVIGNAMAVKVVTDIIFNYQTNAIQRAIGSVPEVQKLYADLNGYYPEEGQPRIMGLKDKMDRSIKTLKSGFQKTVGLKVGVTN